MKVIDLLNKIANGEREFNERIRYVDVSGIQKEYEATSYDIIKGLADVEFCLNDEIEIIEEPKKIEKIKWNEKSNFANCDMSASGVCEMMMARSEQLKKSLNEIIDYINKGE